MLTFFFKSVFPSSCRQNKIVFLQQPNAFRHVDIKWAEWKADLKDFESDIARNDSWAGPST